jgi:hypothetical protein
MYGKILHGASFGGLINYINDPRKDATLVASNDGVNLTNNQTITDSFVMQAGLSARTKKPVGCVPSTSRTNNLYFMATRFWGYYVTKLKK